MPTSPPLHRPHFARLSGALAPAHDGAPKQPRPYDRHWEKLRRAFLARHPLCLFCQQEGRATAAQEVDHITDIFDRPDLRLEWSNLRSLCKSHHSRRTGREVSERRKQRLG